MEKYGDFGERTPDEIGFLEHAEAILRNWRSDTNGSLDHFLEQRETEQPGGYIGAHEKEAFVLSSPQYESAIKAEFEASIKAVEALAKYLEAYENRAKTVRAVELEASRIIMAANAIESLPELSTADIPHYEE